MRARKLLTIAIFLLALAGFAIASVSFAHKESFVSGAFCTIGDTFNCDIVNKGAFSEIYNVPVALIGMIGYGLLALATALLYFKPHDHGFLAFVTLGAIVGLAFSLYLTGIEAFVLETWCLLCLTSQAVVLVLNACVAALIWLTFKRPVSLPETPNA